MRAMAAVSALICMTAVGRAQPRYAFDAAGRPARVDERWELRREDGANIDLLTSLVRCGSQIFVGDTQSRVFRMDTSASPPMLRPFAGEDQGIGRPWALAADCDRDRLYVVNTGPRTIVALNVRTGAVVETKTFKRELYESHTAIVDAGAVYVGGLWNADTPHALPQRDADRFFESTWLGERIPLGEDAAAEGALPSYETRCVAAGACTFADLDRIRGAGSAAWIAVHGISTRVALYDERGHRTGGYDVTSPRFRRDGTELPVRTPPDVTERWKSRNSIVRRVIATADCVATIHTLTEIGPDWQFGQPSQFSVFMNVHGLDGTPLVSDIRLADVPIGRDESHLYVVDYGADGRRNGAERAALLRIPIEGRWP